MERNLDRKTLSFSKGMTNVPSDLLSDDSELLESDGFIYKDGEMKAVQNPVQIGTIPYKIMYVHKMADYENIIAYDEVAKKIHCYKKREDGHIDTDTVQSFETGELYDISSIGNTLICCTENGFFYLLHKGGQYKELGTNLPIPYFAPYFEAETSNGSYSCELDGIASGEDVHGWYDQEGNFFGFYNQNPSSNAGLTSSGDYYIYTVKQDKVTDYLNAVEGCVMKGINGEKERNRFCFPFFIRYALRLFDGSYARISAPIICYPSISRNCHFYSNNKNAKFFFVPISSTLKYAASISGIEDWKDIVKELVIFASDEVMPFYEMDSKTEWDWMLFSGKISNMSNEYGGVYFNNLNEEKHYEDIVTNIILPKHKSNGDIIEELLAKTQFYKLASIKITDTENINVPFSANKALNLKKSVVSSLTSQEQLKVDDYYGWTQMSSKRIFTYNNRTNAFGMYRKPYNGFCNFLADKESEVTTVTYYTHIVSESMDIWVKSEPSKIYNQKALTGWLFYPDPNASEMIINIKSNNSEEKNIKVSLSEHTRLNGSYSFENLPTEDNGSEASISTGVSLPNIDENAKEYMDSQIFTSLVNNPFVFEASGDNTVGTGKIIGIVANTEAVSQGQFGQYPLMVFTDEGIYGLSVNSEGLYSASYPISREVCLENSPLVPTDRLVFFASKKGLMAASGGSVGCMSELMRGRVPRNFAELGEGKFLNFLKDCLIAYDYRDSLLRIFCKGKDYQYIYNMVDKTFSMVNSGIIAQAVVNDYPDNLLQDTSGNVYSLTGKPDINDDEEKYSGHITTRPLKLGGSMTLKSLRDIKNLVDTDDGKISTEIWGSNDCRHWCKLVSLGGKPWKYFTIKYTLKDFKAVDSFAGSVVEVQSRREDKMR